MQRIIKADEAILEIEKSPDKRAALMKEIGGMEYRIDGLREKIARLQAD